jgi:hypothetical protein
MDPEFTTLEKANHSCAPNCDAQVRPGSIHVIWSSLACLRSILWSFTQNDVDNTGPGIMHVIWSFLACLRSTLWSFTPNDVDDTGPYAQVDAATGLFGLVANSAVPAGTPLSWDYCTTEW